jgi:hypothetical protein
MFVIKIAVFWVVAPCSYNPEDSNLHTHRRENLKSYYVCYKLSYKLSHDKDFTGYKLYQLSDGIIFNQTSCSYQLILTIFILVELASHLSNFLIQKSLQG